MRYLPNYKRVSLIPKKKAVVARESFFEHKEFHRKARLFSGGTLAIIVFSVVIVSLFINFEFGRASTTTLEVGSGQTYATIQDAVDAIPSTLTEPVIINIHAGTYTSAQAGAVGIIASKTTSTTNTITIQANGSDTVIIDGETARSAFTVTVSNIIIKGLQTKNTGPSHAILLGVASCDNAQILNNYFVGGSFRQLSIIECNNVIVRNNTFFDPNINAIWNGGSDNTVIDGNTIFQGTVTIGHAHAILINTFTTTSDSIILKNNIISNCITNCAAIYGVSIAAGSTATLNNNDIYNWGVGATTGTYTDGGGNITTDPLFLSTTSTDGSFLYTAPNSPSFTASDTGGPLGARAWTVSLTLDTNSLSAGNTVNFTATSSMIKRDSAASVDNQVQVVMPNGDVVALTYSSASIGSTIWTGSYTVPSTITAGLQPAIVEAIAYNTTTSTALNFTSPPTGFNNTGVTATVCFSAQGVGTCSQSLQPPYTVSLSAITNTPSTTTSVTTWSTNSLTSTKVDYGLTDSYGSTTSETDTSPRVMSHTSSLSSLVSCTTYHYRARSIDASSNETIGSDNTFTTTGCTASAPVTAETASPITTAAGGTVALTSNNTGIALTIPAAFTDTDANIQVKKLDASTVFNTITSPSGYSGISTYTYDLKALSDVGTAVTTFTNPITITMTYADSDLPATMSPSTLKIHRYDGTNWNLLTGCTVDTTAKTVTCTTSNFSTFALFGVTPTQVTSSSSCSNTQPGSITPEITKAEAQSTTSILLTIQDGSDPIDHYSLQYGTSSHNYTQGLSNIGKKGIDTYLVTSLTPNTTYYFVIASATDCVTGTWSQEVSAVTTLAAETPVQTTASEEVTPQTETPPENTPPSTQHAEPIPSPQTPTSLPGSAVTPAVSINECKSYIVKAGDSLWRLAARFLGSGKDYERIAKQNLVTHPLLKKNYDIIWIGWVLKIGCEE